MNLLKYATKINPLVTERYRKEVPPWGPLGFVTYSRTYSRKRPDLGRMEKWVDTIERGINALLEYGMQLRTDEVSLLFEYWFNFKCITAGRGLWQLGTKTVEKIGGDSLMNCWFTSLNSIESFCFLFDELMLGGGVGFSILSYDVHQLPKVKRTVNVVREDKHDVDFIVPDNRKGWVELLRKTLEAFFITGKDFSYSCACIRAKGLPINGFGGTASGSEALVKGISQICKILSDRNGKHIRSIDALDIANIIASVVVSGNVRRSAQLAIGHASDIEYIYAKNWKVNTIPNWRSMSNNSCVTSSIDKLPDEFWSGYYGEGEPYGLVNLDLCRSHGRLIDGKDYRPDYEVKGLNPCGEQCLDDAECCVLVENYLKNLKNTQELMQSLYFSYKMAKTMICLPFSWPQTQKVIEKNRRIGISLTGFAQNHFTKEDFNTGYKFLEDLDEKYSKEINVNESIKLTTVKPSGTVSLLSGSTPGIHPAYAEYYIRRIRFSADDPLIEICRNNGYHTEYVLGFDGKPDLNTIVAEFPIKTPSNTKLAKDCNAIDQLEMHKFAQTYWSDNAVSATIYYRKEELDEIQEWLHANYKESVKSISFLLHNEHGFKQAPYEEITKQQYEELAAKTTPIVSLEDKEERELIDSLECTTGLCPIK